MSGTVGEGGHSAAEDADVVVEFDLTPEEWVDVALEHNRHSDIYRQTVSRSQRSFALLVALLSLLGFLNGFDAFALGFVLVGAGMVVVLPKLLERSHRRSYESFAREGIANGMFGTHRLELLDDGLLDETDAYRRLTRWHAIDRVVDGSGAFLIYLGTNSFLPVPHSAFRDSRTLRAFADRFFERVGGSADSGGADGGAIQAPPTTS